MTLPCIKVDGSKHDTMASSVWSKLEEPLVMIPVEYKIVQRKKGLRNGFIMVTRGAVYIFKTKFFQIQPILDKKLHILDMRKLRIESEMMFIEFDDYIGEIKSKYITSLYVSLQTVISEVTYGVKKIRTFEIESDNPLPVVHIKSRPPQSIRWRALFLAHFYDIHGEQLNTMTYFDKWEDKKPKLLVLGPSFHPGNFGAAFGHAIGWESLIDTVCFQNFAPTQFPRMIYSILDNAQTIQRLAFTDYKEDRFPKFGNDHLLKTSITKWWFLRACAPLIKDFCMFSKHLPSPVEEFMLVTTPFSEEDFIQIVSLIEDSPALRGMKSFSFVRNIMKPFPYDTFIRMLNFSSNLQTLSIRGMETNGSDLLSAICSSKSRLRNLSITHMQFRSSIVDSVSLPPTLVHLNLSFNAFISSSFRTLFHLLSRNQCQIPIVFQAECLVIKPSAYKALEELDFGQCYDNISEIDWSGNTMPSEPSRLFFAFLFTQKHLRLLKLDDMSLEDPIQFMKHVLQLMESLQLPGLEFSGRFEPVTFAQFINALQPMHFIRRLGLKNSNTNDNGIRILGSILPNLPLINELVIDGFAPDTSQMLFDLLRLILTLPNLKSCDIPLIDIKKLKMDISNLKPEQKAVIDNLILKKRPTTIEQRVKCIISLIENHQDSIQTDTLSLVSSPEIFLRTLELGIADDYDDDQFDQYMKQSSATPGHIEE